MQQSNNIKNVLQDEYDFSNNANDTLITSGIATCFGVSIRDIHNRQDRLLTHLSTKTILTGTDSLNKFQEKFLKNGTSLQNCSISICGGSPTTDGPMFYKAKDMLVEKLQNLFPKATIRYTKTTDQYVHESGKSTINLSMLSGHAKTQIGDLSNTEYTEETLSNGSYLKSLTECEDLALRKQHLAYKVEQALKGSPIDVTSPREGVRLAKVGQTSNCSIF